MSYPAASRNGPLVPDRPHDLEPHPDMLCGGGVATRIRETRSGTGGSARSYQRCSGAPWLVRPVDSRLYVGDSAYAKSLGASGKRESFSSGHPTRQQLAPPTHGSSHPGGAGHPEPYLLTRATRARIRRARAP